MGVVLSCERKKTDFAALLQSWPNSIRLRIKRYRVPIDDG